MNHFIYLIIYCHYSKGTQGGKLEKKWTLAPLSSTKRKNGEETGKILQNNIIINSSISNYNKCKETR